MKKKFIASILTAALALSVLTACGSSNDAAAETTTEEAATEQEAATEDAAAEEETTAEETTEEADETAEVEQKGTLKVAASATPHAEILEQAAPILAEQGWTLEVTVFDDYVQPN